MKNNRNAVLAAMALLALPASAQVKIDSITPNRYAAQSIDVGADVNFSREQSTSAVSVITKESTNKRSAKNIGNSILGQGLGLTSLQNSGNYAGIEPTFYIRGLQNLSGDNTPLFVVDGIERDIKYISAEEVESVSVLKDAAATALYGYKGANGVVLITTKRGKFNSKEVKISLDHSINFMANKPKFVNAQTYAKAMNEAYANDGLDPRYSAEEVEAFGNGKYPYLYPNVNWVDETFRNHSVTNMVNASFTGGSDKFKYYAMLDLQYDNGFVKNPNENEGYSTNNKYVKGNLRMNMDMQLTNNTLMKVNILGVLSESNAPGNTAKLWDMVYSLPSAAYPVKDENGRWGGSSVWAGTVNPVAQSQGAGYSRNNTRGIYTDLTLREDLSTVLKGLSAQARIGYDHFSNIYEQYDKTYEYGSHTIADWVDGEPQIGKDFTGGTPSDLGSTAKTNSFSRRFHLDASVDYQNTFGIHSIYSQLKYDYEFSDSYAINSTIYRQNVSWYSHYGLLNRYYLDLALVESGSNRLAPDSKWGLSPTVSAAWVLSNEGWLKNVNWVDFLKLRASYGIIQTDNVPDGDWTYYMQQYQTTGGSYPFNNGFGTDFGRTYLGRMATTGLTREKATKYNVGLDATLLGGLDVTADAYYQRRSNIWVSTAGKYSSEIGVDAPYEGDGIVDSWGWELGLDYNKQIGDVKFNVGGNFSYTRSQIKEQDEAPVLYDNLRTTGHRVSQLFGYKAIGFFKDEEDIANSKPQNLGTAVRPGDIKFEDVNNDGVIDSNDKTAIGYSTVAPEIYYNIHLGVEWKGLGIDAMFQGTGRYTGVLTTKSMYKPLVDNTTISQYYYDNRWTPETAATAKFPALSSSSNANNYNTNTLWMFDRSFFKLRNIEVYYNFPKALLAKTKALNAAKLYVRGVDLFSLDHLDVSDPESYGATNPLNRSIVAGLAVTF